MADEPESKRRGPAIAYELTRVFVNSDAMHAFFDEPYRLANALHWSTTNKGSRLLRVGVTALVLRLLVVIGQRKARCTRCLSGIMNQLVAL